MTLDDAVRLLGLSREARWTFPSSSGRPVPREAPEWVERFLAEKASFVEAAHLLLASGHAQQATEIAANVWRLWILSRDIGGGHAFLSVVLDAAPPEPTRARALALYGDGLFAFWRGALDEARARNDAAVAAAQASGDPEALALAHLGRSRVALSDGDHALARTLAERARELARPRGEAMGQAPLHMCAQAAWAEEDLAAAAALFSESLELNRRIGDEGMVVVELHNLGHVEVRRGNVDEAERLFEECARHEKADDAYGLAMREVNAAAIACARRQRDLALDRLSRAEAMLSKLGVDPSAEDQSEIRWVRSQLSRPDGA